MTKNTYAYAVETFEALLAKPNDARHVTPASLIRAVGLPPSSGYRHVATLEAEGFLRRDGNGAYQRGVSGIRTGLRACNAGQIAPVAEAIVAQLRQTTQHSAFLAVAEELSVFVGPHSTGRQTRQTEIRPRYLFESVPDLVIGNVVETGLRYLDAGIARRMSAILIPLEKSGSGIVLLGLVQMGHRSDTAHLRTALMDAFDRIGMQGETTL